MRYSMRSLMRFSIRDVFWLFIVGLVLAMLYVKGPPPPRIIRLPLRQRCQLRRQLSGGTKWWPTRRAVICSCSTQQPGEYGSSILENGQTVNRLL